MSIPKNSCIKLEASWVLDIDKKQIGQCPIGNWFQNCQLMSSRMFLHSWISATEMVTPLNREEVYSSGLSREVWSTHCDLGNWSGWRKSAPQKSGSPKTVWPTLAKAFYYAFTILSNYLVLFFATPQPNSERSVKTLHCCLRGKLASCHELAGEVERNCRLVVGILIKSFMRGNS